MQKAMALGTSRTLLSMSLLSSTKFNLTPFLKFPKKSVRVLSGFRPLCSSTTPTISIDPPEQLKHSMLLERLRLRHLKDSNKPTLQPKTQEQAGSFGDKEGKGGDFDNNKKKRVVSVGSFEELGLSEEVMGAVREIGIEVPTEIQCIGIPAILDEKSVVLGSHTGSGKTLAYLLPLVQLLRRDEAELGRLMKPRRPRAVVLCPTRELSEQVFRVAKSISHHARFRSIMVSGGGRLRPQEDSLNNPIDMVVGTPGRILQHIEDGNIVYGDIKYVVLDEADTMFDRGFGPEIRKFLAPLKHRATKPDGQGFQTILVAATMTKAVQKLIDEEFQGITHLRTSTLHKKIASARHDFIKLSGSENKLEALLQVLEPSLAKGNKVMVFCNTLNSSRAVDHFLNENQISTVNYHGEVPAEQRVENLNKFKNDDGDCPTLVCTDLAARGLDLDVDHVIMFDFPSNSVDYLHRTGRTARMGAKGKVTSLVAKKDVLLAERIEEAIRKNESLESLTTDNIRRDIARAKITQEKGKVAKLVKTKTKAASEKSSSVRTKVASTNTATRKSSTTKSGKTSVAAKSSKPTFKVSKSKSKSFTTSSSKKASTSGRKQTENRTSSPGKSRASKLRVVGFRGRASYSDKRGLMRPS
ncbi:DEAD-box ATP-dependent RNA helicase 39-like [Mangifera indica]|uniref:DEAD-box ATP-dependent RNA helicase 39-like n=1 Tax=Mangifera indica TaxID=29780 RepID=UPI001CFA223F|nr:DEAD-box ATP-dependent RNA helicase 39-like [Mangifera indica]